MFLGSWAAGVIWVMVVTVVGLTVGTQVVQADVDGGPNGLGKPIL